MFIVKWAVDYWDRMQTYFQLGNISMTSFINTLAHTELAIQSDQTYHLRNVVMETGHVELGISLSSNPLGYRAVYSVLLCNLTPHIGNCKMRAEKCVREGKCVCTQIHTRRTDECAWDKAVYKDQNCHSIPLGFCPPARRDPWSGLSLATLVLGYPTAKGSNFYRLLELAINRSAPPPQVLKCCYWSCLPLPHLFFAGCPWLPLPCYPCLPIAAWGFGSWPSLSSQWAIVWYTVCSLEMPT